MKKTLKKLILICFAVVAGFSAMAQNQVKGVVTDETGGPLPGVTVVIAGTSNGTVTGSDGYYAIQTDGEATLIFSFVGMVTQEIEVNNRSMIDVTLKNDAIGLEEVQVVGYGVQKKVTVTGSISNITNEELVKSPSANVTNALAGRITGIAAVQNTGQPGADEAALYIRGVATLNNASPLTIVDGVERPFSQLDPEEIESIAVLKDASATAVYGVRGANGVIIVTTKRGQKGKAKISVSTSIGLQQPTMLLDKSDSYEYALAHNERNINDGNDPSTNVFNDEVLEIFKNGGNILFPNTDWFDYLFKDFALQTKTNFTASGGTTKVRYFTALGYLSQGGQLNDFDPRYDENFNFKRFNYRSNLDIDVTKSTLIKVSLGGRTEIRNSPKEHTDGIWKIANWAQPFAGSGVVDGKWVSTSQDNVNIEMKDPMSGFYGKGYDNQTRNYLDFDLDLVQKLDFITKGLRARVKGSYNTNYTHTKSRGSSPDHYESIYMPGDSTQVVFRKIGDEGNVNYSESTGKARNWYMEAAFDYSRKFGDHDLGALVLYNQRVLNYPGGDYNDIPMRTLGFVGRITYNYMTKYLFDINMGYNGSENFPEGKRYGFFPAVSLGWVVSEESFMENVDFIEYFKIRGSYGLVGNDRLGSNRFLYLPDAWNYQTDGYNFGIDNPSDQPGATELRIGNPNVTWETATKQNYGVDLNFIGGMLGVSLDYFHELRKDILITRNTVPVFVAAELPAVNMGEVENQGYEVELKWNQKIGKDFIYRINANMSYAHNEIIFKDEIPQPYDYLYETGNPVGQPFGYITNGFFTEEVNTTTSADYPDHGGIRYPGDLMYKDLNDDGVIDDLDKMPVGYSYQVPEYNYGASLYMNWKGIDLSVTFAGVKNTSRVLPSYFREPFGGQNRGLFHYLYEGRWTPETAETAMFPRFSSASSSNNYRDSELYIRDASYLRLKNIELGYNINSPWLKRAGLRNVRVFANGYNLLTWSDFDYFDPESRVGASGLYPMTKVYNMGLKFNF